MIVIIHASTLFAFIASGPVYPRHKELFTENCQRYWWSALLYLQNFVNGKNMVWINMFWTFLYFMTCFLVCSTELVSISRYAAIHSFLIDIGIAEKEVEVWSYNNYWFNFCVNSNKFFYWLDL